MTRQAIGPFLATGVALAGAAAIVANPIVPPPADIRISAAEYAANGRHLDVLDPEFLESIGAKQKGWQNPVRVLESLLSGLVEEDPNADLAPLASTLARFIEGDEPALLLSTIAAATIDDPVGEMGGTGGVVADVIDPAPDTPGVLDGLFPDGGASEMVVALADIGEGFGTAGVTFLQQIGMVPAAVSELAQQVRAGTLRPDEALRRLLVAPLLGHPQLTGIPSIDAVFTTGLLQPVFDSLINYLPAPFGQPGGVFDSVAIGITGAATGAGSNGTASTLSSTAATSAPTTVGDGQPTSQTVTENPPATDQLDDAATGDGGLTADQPESLGGTGTSGLNSSRSGRPGGFVDRVTDTINDFTGAFSNPPGGGGQTPGQGAGSAAPGSPSGGEGSTGNGSSAGGAGTAGSGPSAGGAGSSPGSDDGN